jgi:hypothetical protein
MDSITPFCFHLARNERPLLQKLGFEVPEDEQLIRHWMAEKNSIIGNNGIVMVLKYLKWKREE